MESDELNFSSVIFKGPVNSDEGVQKLCTKMKLVIYCMEYPETTSETFYTNLGMVIVNALVASPSRRGVYHYILPNPVRINPTAFNATDVYTLQETRHYTRLNDKHCLGISPKYMISMGLYECSLTLSVTDYNWDLYEYLYSTEALNSTQPCDAELTMTLIRKVGAFPERCLRRQPLMPLWMAPVINDLKGARDKVKHLIDEFKNAFAAIDVTVNNNLVSNTGVVANDTTGVGTARLGLAAAGYGTDKAIFGYGYATGGGTYVSMTNLVSNTGVVATDTTGVGTARYYLAAAGYGSSGQAIFGYGNNGASVSMTNLVSNTGVVATDTTGVGTARFQPGAAAYG